MTTPSRRRRLGELLVEIGLLDEAQLKQALAEQRRWGGKLGRTLVEMGLVDEQTMATTLGKHLELRTVDLDTAPLPEAVTSALRLDLAERYGVFPVSFDPGTQVLALAMSDPTNAEAIEELERATSLEIVPVVATASAIDRAVRRYYFGEAPGVSSRGSPVPSAPVETNFELDELLGRNSQPTAAAAPAALQELAALRERVEALEKTVSGQVRSLRSVLELLIESGLLTREEYLIKLHRPE